MAKNMKLNLDELKVQSYVVALSETETNFIKGGYDTVLKPGESDTLNIEESMDSETEVV